LPIWITAALNAHPAAPAGIVAYALPSAPAQRSVEKI